MMLLLMALLVVAVTAAALALKRLASWLGLLEVDRRDLISLLSDRTSTEPAPRPSIFSPPSKALSVIVPAYNEEGRLATTLDEVLDYLKRRRNRQGPGFTYEVVVVDDGSKDKTVQVANEYVRKHGSDAVRVLQGAQNRGKGHAVRRGMLSARGEYCLFADADGATRFSDLEALEAALVRVLVDAPGKPARSGATTAGGEHTLGVAVGSRAHLQEAALAKRTALRNFLMKGFHLCVWAVAGGQVRDTQCGFKLLTRRAAAVLFANQRLQRFSFDVELLYIAHTLGIPVTEVHVNWTEIPGSKIRFTSILHMAMELVAIKVGYQILGTWRVVTEGEWIAKTK